SRRQRGSPDETTRPPRADKARRGRGGPGGMPRSIESGVAATSSCYRSVARFEPRGEGRGREGPRVSRKGHGGGGKSGDQEKGAGQEGVGGQGEGEDGEEGSRSETDEGESEGEGGKAGEGGREAEKSDQGRKTGQKAVTCA